MSRTHALSPLTLRCVVAVGLMGLVSMVLSEDADKIEQKLAKSRDAYSKTQQAIRDEVLVLIEQREKVERKRKTPNEKTVDELKEQRDRLVNHQELPVWIDLNRKKRTAKANVAFLEALIDAKKGHVRNGSDMEAMNVEMEIQNVKKEIRAFRARFDTANAIAENVKYQFVNQESGLALDVLNSSPMNAVILVQAVAAESPSQLWTLKRVNKQFQIINSNSGLLINVPFGSTNSGTQLIQFDNQRGRNNELWSFAQRGKGFVFLSPNRLAIAIPEGAKNEGSAILQKTPENKDSEVWLLIPAQ